MRIFGQCHYFLRQNPNSVSQTLIRMRKIPKNQSTFHSKQNAKNPNQNRHNSQLKKQTEARNVEFYPFPHQTKVAGLELIPRRALEAEHEKLPFEVDYLLIQLLGRLLPDLLQLILSLPHHHHRRGGGGRSPAQRRGGAARGAQVRDANAVKCGRREGFREARFCRQNHGRN